MSFDNLGKLLVEKYPAQFAAWILGQAPDTVRVLKTELSIEPIRADSVLFVQTRDSPGATLSASILHLEFQTRLPSEPPIEFRMLDYWVRLYRLHQVPIIQVVIVLLPPTEGTVIPTQFHVGRTLHEYDVLCLWEQDPQLLLQDLALLPLAPLAAAPQPETLLQQVAARIRQLESEQQRRELSTYTQIFAGLRFKKPLIRQIFQEGLMRESVIYQEILQEGRQEGRQEGELNLTLRLLKRRFGEIALELETRVRGLSLAQLEALAEALFDFDEVADVQHWLDRLEA
ncbi:Rpn family recombination-promoting nuclease/putative transposase [Trichothermofontia sp.]